jgi:hypothetical protein
VCRLLFNVIRSMSEEWSSPVVYPPLDETQVDALEILRNTLDEEDDEAIDVAFHNACYKLYAHERHDYRISEDLDKLFSPVNIFLIYLSFGGNGNFKVPSVITGNCAALEYSIRSVMLIQVDSLAKINHASAFEYVILHLLPIL